MAVGAAKVADALNRTPGAYQSGWLTYTRPVALIVLVLAPTVRTGVSRVKDGVANASGGADGVVRRGEKG